DRMVVLESSPKDVFDESAIAALSGSTFKAADFSKRYSRTYTYSLSGDSSNSGADKTLSAPCTSKAGEVLAINASLPTGAPEVLHTVQPIYPREAARPGIQGCTVISFIVTSDGLADEYEVVESVPKGMFDKASLVALNGWRFEPPSS